MGQDAQYIILILSFIGLIDFKGETHSISQNNWHEFAASISKLDKLHFESYQSKIGTRRKAVYGCHEKGARKETKTTLDCPDRRV